MLMDLMEPGRRAGIRTLALSWGRTCPCESLALTCILQRLDVLRPVGELRHGLHEGAPCSLVVLAHLQYGATHERGGGCFSAVFVSRGTGVTRSGLVRKIEFRSPLKRSSRCSSGLLLIVLAPNERD